jgi:hypothetical protein
MTCFSSAISSACRSLGNHLFHLRRSFEALAEQVRDAIARAIGRTVAEAVSEAIHAALAEPGSLPAPPRSSNRPRPLWDDTDAGSWPDDRDQLCGSSRFASDDRPSDDEDLDDDEPPDATPPPTPMRRALAAACRAAAYWLERHHGRFSLAAAVGVAVIAGVAVLVTGPSLAGGSGVATSAFGLLALEDTVRSGSLAADLLAQHARSRLTGPPPLARSRAPGTGRGSATSRKG